MKRLSALLTFLLVATIPVFAAIHEKQREPLHVSLGEQIALSDFLVPGKIVIFDFSSEYCPPCRAYNLPLKALHAQREDIVVVRVDVNRPGIKRIDWESPVVQQYEIHSLPHFKVYSAAGKLMAEDTADDKKGRKLVNSWVSALGP